jgi:hypothetical protein
MMKVFKIKSEASSRFGNAVFSLNSSEALTRSKEAWTCIKIRKALKGATKLTFEG